MPEIIVRDPATGEVIGGLPIADGGTVAATIARARLAQVGWAALSVKERCLRLREARRSFVRARAEIADLLARETGKTRMDVIGEVIAVCLDFRSACRFAPSALVSERVGNRVSRKQRWIVRRPFGVVGVIGPWNAPLTLTLGDAIYALVAGNSVVVKPSELTPLAVHRAVLAMAQALPTDVFQLVAGDASTGEALVDGVDMICVTGSPSTGRRVMQRAAQRLTPVLLELGGKDAMIVLEDANLERAANAAVWGAFFMTGQVCMSIERIYVAEVVADEFTALVVDKTGRLRIGPNTENVDLGPLTSERQVGLVEGQVREAVDGGATALVGGGRLAALGAQFFAPTVLSGVTAEMKIAREETFGPVVCVTRVRSDEEAIALANDSPFGLNASVWTKDLIRGRAIAERLETGSACVNDCILNAGDPELPFGGVKQSGVGARHGGVDGVRAFTRARALRIDPGRTRRDAPWFPYRGGAVRWIDRVIGWLWG